MFIIPGKNFALWASVLKQESYLSYVRKEINRPIFKYFMQKTRNKELPINKLLQRRGDIYNKHFM